MKTRNGTDSTSVMESHLKRKPLFREESNDTSMPKQQIHQKKKRNEGSMLHPWTNIQTEEYMAAFTSPDRPCLAQEEKNTIKTATTRYSKKYQESMLPVESHKVMSYIASPNICNKTQSSPEEK